LAFYEVEPNEEVRMTREALRLSLAVVCLLGATAVHAPAGEIMRDRCKQDVVFVPPLPSQPAADARPGMPGTVLLKRRSDGKNDWSNVFQMKLVEGGFVRWWCYTGGGTGFEPGVWQLNQGDDGTRCLFSDVIKDCHPDPNVRQAAPVWGRDWTAERSRCKDRSTKFRARLGSSRLLQIECMGK
jgi:hypothetical protein